MLGALDRLAAPGGDWRVGKRAARARNRHGRSAPCPAGATRIVAAVLGIGGRGRRLGHGSAPDGRIAAAARRPIGSVLARARRRDPGGRGRIPREPTRLGGAARGRAGPIPLVTAIVADLRRDPRRKSWQRPPARGAGTSAPGCGGLGLRALATGRRNGAGLAARGERPGRARPSAPDPRGAADRRPSEPGSIPTEPRAFGGGGCPEGMSPGDLAVLRRVAAARSRRGAGACG